MVRAIVTASSDEARATRARIDAALGLPASSTNGATGIPSLSGWTETACDIVQAPDYPVRGVTSYLLPIRPDDEATAAAIGLVAVDIDMAAIPSAVVLRVREVSQIDRPRSLADAKAAGIAEIRRRAAKARDAGFVHSDGRSYTLDHDACRQIMEAKAWAIYDQSNGTSYMKYPLVWPSIDRAGAVVMAKADDVVAFALAYSLADRALTERMAGLEMQVTQATTPDQIAAIVGAA